MAAGIVTRLALLEIFLFSNAALNLLRTQHAVHVLMPSWV
jgi:hypothetical protein